MRDTANALPVAGAVLVGGSSRRMGTDKALIEIDGTPMARRCVLTLRAAGLSPIAIVGGEAGAFEGWGTDHVVDEWPGEGPLGAIITAFRSIETELLMVLPCDLLEPTSSSIVDVIHAIGSHDGVVPMVEGREQWLFSVWHRRCEGILEAEFNRGVRSIRTAASALDLNHPVATAGAIRPGPYDDADTPEQLNIHRPPPAG